MLADRSLFHGVEHRKPVNHTPKDGVLPVEVGRLCVRDKELRAVRVRTAVGVREDAPAVVPQRGGELVLELVPPYAAPALPPPRGVAALHDELGDVPVEHRVVVVPGGAECEEVLACLWDEVAVQLHLDVAEVCLQRDAHFSFFSFFLFYFFNLLTCKKKGKIRKERREKKRKEQ